MKKLWAKVKKAAKDTASSLGNAIGESLFGGNR